jgi:PHD/YefM family antitoxin component YafN of YafNO toxin-antitoxin module
MKLLAMSIVSNSEMIKNYKTCREKAGSFGKVFILKNNQPDAVLFSIAEYERLSVLIEYMESLDGNDIAKVIESLPKEGNRKIYSIDNLRNKIKDTEEKDTEEKDTKVLAMDFSFN